MKALLLHPNRLPGRITGSLCSSLLIALAIVWCGQPTARAATLMTSADAYIFEGNPTSNYGTEDTLVIKNNNDGNARKIYLQFDRSSIIGDMESVTLTLNVSNDTGTGDGTIPARTYNLFGLTTESPWTETGITWNNAPANEDSALGFDSNATLFQSDNFASGSSSITFTLGTAALDYLNNDVDGIVTFMIWRTNVTNTFDYFYSSESGSNGPVLAFTAVPEPTALGLLATGGLLVLARRRRA